MAALSPAPIVVVAALLAGVAALVAGRSRWTAPATGPWAVAGGAIVVASRAGVYDSLISPPSAGVLVAAVGALAGAVWVGAGHLPAEVAPIDRDRHFAAVGAGLALVVVLSLVTHLSVPAFPLLWVVVAPLGAAALAALGYVLAGFVLTGLLSELRLAGLYAVGTVVFEGVASAVADRVLAADPGGVLAPVVRSALAAAAVAPSPWLVVTGHLTVGLAVAATCARLARWRQAVGHAGVIIVAVLAAWAGTVVLLSAVVGG
jgi:hypothetical protein